MRKVVAIVFVCCLAAGAAFADAFGVSPGASIATLNGLYCQLAGCTMAGNTQYASGTIGLQAADNSINLIQSTGTARGTLDIAAGLISLQANTAAGGTKIGTSVSAAATQIIGSVGDDATTFAFYGAGLAGVPAGGLQSAACAANALALDIQSSRVEISQVGAANCTATVAETSAQAGTKVDICVTSISGGAASIDFADQPNILNIGGAYSMGAEDCLSLIYLSTGIWVETGRSNN